MEGRGCRDRASGAGAAAPPSAGDGRPSLERSGCCGKAGGPARHSPFRTFGAPPTPTASGVSGPPAARRIIAGTTDRCGTSLSQDGCKVTRPPRPRWPAFGAAAGTWPRPASDARRARWRARPRRFARSTLGPGPGAYRRLTASSAAMALTPVPERFGRPPARSVSARTRRRSLPGAREASSRRRGPGTVGGAAGRGLRPAAARHPRSRPGDAAGDPARRRIARVPARR